jgi:hypothetical protein
LRFFWAAFLPRGSHFHRISIDFANSNSNSQLFAVEFIFISLKNAPLAGLRARRARAGFNLCTIQEVRVSPHPRSIFLARRGRGAFSGCGGRPQRFISLCYHIVRCWPLLGALRVPGIPGLQPSQCGSRAGLGAAGGTQQGPGGGVGCWVAPAGAAGPHPASRVRG